MKKYFVILLVAIAAAFTSCGDDQTENGSGSEWFQKPATAVAGTTVDVVCQTNFANGVLDTANPGFVYAPASGPGAGSYLEADPVYVNGNTITCRLTGLDPETAYVGYAYIEVGSAGRMMSDPVSFKTGQSDGPVAPDAPSFGEPSSTNITTTTATVNCSFDYKGDKKITEAYFVYTSSTGVSQNLAVTTALGLKSAQLADLSEATSYSFRLSVLINGTLYSSKTASFTTQKGADPDPDPDPDPTPAETLFAGWAELPTTIDKSGNWYYAYHLTDVNAPTGNKARNYTVCYSNEMKCAIWVAAPMHTFYSKKNSNRTDAYKPDPKIPISQPGKWSGYTRGHMLGSGERLVSRTTNEQVFYHANIAPQLQTYFNTGGGAWNTLEDWVDTQWNNSADTTYQVIGSYWANKKKVVNGTTIPTHYYKVLLRTKGHKNKWVQNCTRDELQCIAIMVEHRTYSKSEVPKPSQYESKGMLYSVKQMEEMTGLKFFGNVPNAPKDTYNVSDWGF